MELNDMTLMLPDTLMIVLDELDALDPMIMDDALEISQIDPSTFGGAGRWIQESKAAVLVAALIRNSLGTRAPTDGEADAIRSWFADAIAPAE